MAFDMFMEFLNTTNPAAPKVVGESQDPKHPNMIQVTSVTFGIENPSNIGSAATGAGGGKAKFDVMEVSKPIDSASASLFSVAGLGQHFSDATLYVRRGGAPADYLIYKFKLVFINSIKWTGDSGDDHPLETVEVAFGAMQVSYTPQTPTGLPSGKALIGTWNQVTNTPDLNVPGA